MKVARRYTPLWVKCQHSFQSRILNNIFQVLIVLLAFISYSCTKDNSPLYSNSVIKGSTALWQEWVNDPAVNIIASGPYGNVSTISGPGGSFVLSQLGNGTYSLEFSKEGYGKIKKYNIQLFGNDTIDIGFNYIFKKYDNFELPALTAVNIETFSSPVAYIATNKIITDTELPAMPVVVYLSSEKNVSYNSRGSVICRNLTTIRRDLNKIYFAFSTSSLTFKSGTEVFLIAYVGNPEEILNGYFDSFLGVEQFSTLIPEKHSQVMSFIMP